jgi:hypothetical protein
MLNLTIGSRLADMDMRAHFESRRVGFSRWDDPPDQEKNRMNRPDDKTPLLGLIRLLGLIVVLFVGMASAPSDTTALAPCKTYLLEECVDSTECLDEAGYPCGGRPEGCEGEGWVACGPGNCPYPEIAQVCYFEEVE